MTSTEFATSQAPLGQDPPSEAMREPDPGISSSSIITSPLRTAETFTAYCAQVQAKLAEHASQRKDFLQSAHDRLTRLLQTARDVGDLNLYNELGMHRIAARELLDALSRLNVEAPAAYDAQPMISGEIGPASPPMRSGPPPMPGIGAASPPPQQERYLPSGPPFFPHRQASHEEGGPPAPRFPRRPMRPIADIEADARRLRDEVRNWNNLYPLTRPSGELNIPNCLRLRAIASRQRKLEEEGGDTEIAEVAELVDDIVDLMDAANDQEYTVALDDELDPRPTAWQWGEMAERYEEMVRGQEAFEWWQKYRTQLTVSDVQPLAEAVAAVQQRFNRLLFRVGARDPFQQRLFDDLRTWAREDQCYLYSLRPKVPMQELVERASTLEDSWEHARQPVLEEERRQQLIDNVITLVNEPEFGATPELDERRLQDMLAECKNLRIPASDRRLRDALLPWAAFVEGDERFKDILREITLEWERRQETGRPEEPEEEPDTALEGMTKELEAVREVTRGKRCLLLGGTCREENRRKIEAALELTELVWPSTKPSDPLAKFDTEIRHADIVVLLTRFSRKEWKNAQDICARENKKFVHLTTGYGVSQVVHHFYLQIAPEGAAHAG